MVLDIKNRFGTSVRSRRKRLGFSQEELAGRAGLHRTYVADIERGARNLSLANIEKLAKALDTTISTLFAEGDATNKTPVSDELHDVLVVQDEPDLSLTLQAFKNACLSNRIQVARDGAGALEFLLGNGSLAQRKNGQLPQLILLDLNLPRMNGLELLRRLKGDARTRSIPVAILTNSERSREVDESRRLGAEGHIVKPVDFHRLSRITPHLKLCWALLKLRPAS